ncbi:hypothetical protein N7G274_006618 [Stereocaulon virgatum]|uniref:Uncharacterized protein n=1 Tax=Stereocaulon virgatum TaxID=373712 RepID=A0ABR4A7C0_9LECA
MAPSSLSPALNLPAGAASPQKAAIAFEPRAEHQNLCKAGRAEIKMEDIVRIAKTSPLARVHLEVCALGETIESVNTTMMVRCKDLEMRESLRRSWFQQSDVDYS